MITVIEASLKDNKTDPRVQFNKIQPYSDILFSLMKGSDVSGFNDLVVQIRRIDKLNSEEEAYEEAELLAIRFFKVRKYASYDTFRQMRNASLKKGKLLPKQREKTDIIFALTKNNN